MITKDISFCDKTAKNICSNQHKAQIQQILKNNYNISIIQRHHIDFNDYYLQKIQTDEFFMTYKSNGNPYFLLLIKINGINQCIFIDKKIKQGHQHPRMIINIFYFEDEMFDGTLFDGEVIKDFNNQWHFIINDLIGRGGQNIQKKYKFHERLSMLYKILDNDFTRQPDFDPCSFQIKKYFLKNQIQELLDYCQYVLNFSYRGVYFKQQHSYASVLLNFNCDLIEKEIKNNEYQMQFINKIDNQIINKNFQNQKNVDQTQSVYDSASSIQNEIRQNQNNRESQGQNYNHQETKQLKVYKTQIDDVYKVLQNDQRYSYNVEDRMNINIKDSLIISNQEQSIKMYRLFANKNINQYVVLSCKYDTQKKRYYPVLE